MGWRGFQGFLADIPAAQLQSFLSEVSLLHVLRRRELDISELCLCMQEGEEMQGGLAQLTV